MFHKLNVILGMNDDCGIKFVDYAVKFGEGLNELSFCWF